MIHNYYPLFVSLSFLICLAFQLAEPDQELYKNFNIVISERWQQEIADTVFEVVNSEADKLEQKKKAKQKTPKFDNEEKG